MNNKTRTKQTVKFLKWIENNPGWWHLICNPNDERISRGLMKVIVEELSKEGFYELIFVLLMVHRKQKFMDGITKLLLLDSITKQWKNGDKEFFIKNLLCRLD